MTVRVLQCHASPAGLHLHGAAPAQGQAFHLVVGEDHKTGLLVATALADDLHVGHGNVVGKHLWRDEKMDCMRNIFGGGGILPHILPASPL